MISPETHHRQPDDPALRTVLSRPDADTIVITAVGDVDLCTAAQLGELLNGRVRSVVDRLVVDLSAVSFIDSAGLAVLHATQMQGAASGTEVRFVSTGNRALTRALAAAGMEDSLELDASVPIACLRPAAPQIPA